MKIKTITSQSRRDFRAVYECEHCGNSYDDGYGYDDKYFHENVIPKMRCGKCDKTAGDDYRPIPTKYEEGRTV